MIHFKSTFSKFDQGLWPYHFPVADDIAAQFISGTDRRVVCTINNVLTIHSAIMPGNGRWFIMLNKQIVTKLRLKPGDQLDIKMEKDVSEYGMPMPEEMMVSLDQDEDANTYFHKLTPGKQRTLIYIVSKVKSPDIRINKALAIMHHLKETSGVIDFKLLNETLKMFNEYK
ncbi:MAG: YdeI/OmpD-associated family protein [Saprospiraceae bacterium]|nr:YdeI/OmpD-associated family protein [Saprospiraceae bacterium]